MEFERYIDTERGDGAITTWWYLKGPDGIVQFMNMFIRPLDLHIPVGIGVHSHQPFYPDQMPFPCKLIDPCYFVNYPPQRGKDLFARYSASHNVKDIWTELEAVYKEQF